MKSVTFNTSISKKDIYLIMKEITNSDSGRFGFVGNIKIDGFSVMRYHLFSNNVLNPQINATVIENKNGTEIDMKASLNKYDKIGFSIFGILVCIFFMFLVINAIVTGDIDFVFSAVALLLFEILISILFGFIFILKTKRTVKILKSELI